MPSELIFLGNVFSMIFTSIFLQSLKGVRAGLNYASEGEFEFSTKVGGLSSDAGQSPIHHQNQLRKWKIIAFLLLVMKWTAISPARGAAHRISGSWRCSLNLPLSNQYTTPALKTCFFYQN